MNRTKAREYAFVLLFEYKFQPSEMESILSDFIEEFQPGAQQEYIERVVRGAVQNIDAIDGIIDGVSNEWKVERISCVSIAVLRLAVYEMQYDDDIPVGVAIDEAVELSKRFGQESSGAFVNGILAALAG